MIQFNGIGEKKLKKDNIMKRIMMMIITVFLLCTGSELIIAEEIILDNSERNDIEQVIRNAENHALEESGVSSVSDLSYEAICRLLNEINRIKAKYHSYYIGGAKNSGNYIGYGDILVTVDNVTSGFYHGHAGIVHYSGTTIEANPGDGVAYYSNKLLTTWRYYNSGGVYKVNHATDSNYNTAHSFAVSKIGYPYGLTGSNSYYCSELVYDAWLSAGFSLEGTKGPLDPILPYHIAVDSDTYMFQSFPY